MLKKLIERFEDHTELPIEVEEIAKVIVEMGVRDEILFVGVEADPSPMHGTFKRYTYHKQVYGDPIWVTHISYNSNDSPEERRVVCAKEMIHIFDSDLERTDTEDQVPDLLDKLLGPLTTDDFGHADYMAAKDKVALYQCLPLLFPKAALEIARKAVTDGQKTPEEVADWAKLPIAIVKFMLLPGWDKINGAVTDNQSESG